MPERQSKLQMTERRVDDVTILALAGEILLDDGDIAFGKRVDALLARGDRKIVIDLSGVTYIDSAGVGMMVAEQKIVRQKGATMKLVGLTTRNNRLLSTMRLSTVFEVFDEETSALRSFGWNARNGAGG